MARFAIVLIAILSPTLALAEGRAYIGYVEGIATLVRDGSPRPAVIDTPMFTGDRVRTGGNGRVDIVFPDGATLVVERHSEVELLTPFRVRLIAGSLEHRAAEPGTASSYLAPYGYVWYATPAAQYPRAAHHYGHQRDPYRPPTPDFRSTGDDRPRSVRPSPLIAPWPLQPVATSPTTVPTAQPPAVPAAPPAARHLVTAPVGAGAQRPKTGN